MKDEEKKKIIIPRRRRGWRVAGLSRVTPNKKTSQPCQR
jgi:hypothetical protein